MTVRNQFLVVNRCGAATKVKLFRIIKKSDGSKAIQTVLEKVLKDGDYFPLADQDDMQV
jgi:hypothetical protein